MKIYLSIAFLALVFLSCSKEEGVPVLTPYIIEASAGEETPSAKTIVDPTDDSRLLWSAHEQVCVFSGYLPYLFTGTNASASASAYFAGDGPATLGTYIMATPYDVSAYCDGGIVTTTLPALQEGYAGGYAPGTAILAGRSSTLEVNCKHVCSGIRFKVTGSDIVSVTLKGNNNEKIAGRFSFEISEGVPTVYESGTADQVTLLAPGGGTFAPNSWYYITCLPKVFSKGITLTAVKTNGQVGTYSTGSSPLTFNRAKYKNKTNLDGSMSWTSASPDVSNTYYGPANTFCLRPDESKNVDIAPKLILPGWLRSGISFAAAPAADGCEVLWNTGTVTASLAGSTLTLNAGAGTGSALVAIKNGATILWSFLVWVTASTPDDITLPSGAEMQEPLGGDLYFQWGRKDPLQSTAARVDQRGLSNSITLPQKFLHSDGNTYDWYTDSPSSCDGTLWGRRKTVWDPCPEGWKVPLWDAFAGLSASDGRFSPKGYISDDGYNEGSLIYYWTATSHTGVFSYAFNNSGSYTSITRNIAAPVRCVRE